MFTQIKNSIAALLIVAFMAPGLFLGITPAKEVEAADFGNFGSIAGGAAASIMACLFSGMIADFMSEVFGGVMGAAASIMSVPVNETNQNLLSDTDTTAGTNTDLLYKECVLDPLAWAVKRAIIDGIMASILGWINDGFDGGPSFLTDPETFFRDISFATLDGFLNDSNLPSYLCQPFSLDVRILVNRIATTPNYGPMPSAGHTCSLNDIFGAGLPVSVNVAYTDMVENGNISFPGGGLSAVRGLAISGNNPFGAFFNTQSEAAMRTQDEVGREADLLNKGDGYFSIRCDYNGDGEDEVCTPGQFVALQVDDTMGGALSELEVADEVSEIINAIIAALVQRILTEVNSTMGLLGGA